MIASITGQIKDVKGNYLIVEVGGIGYKVFAPLAHYDQLQIGQNISLYTYQHIREEALDLFGFISEEELSLFEKLLTVSSVGPKSALAIMGIARAQQLEEAILSEDLDFLTSVSGVGKKTAQRIILELKGKIVDKGDKTITGQDREVIEGLVNMGYTVREAQLVVSKIPASVEGTANKLKEAFKILGSK